MRQIGSLPLFLGGVRELRDVQSLYEAEIAAVVDLAAAESVSILPRELIYCRFPIVDGGTNPAALLGIAIRTVSEFLRAGLNTFVCCGAGLSRAPSIAAGALAVESGISPKEALTQIATSGPHDVHPLLWNQVCEIVAELR